VVKCTISFSGLIQTVDPVHIFNFCQPFSKSLMDIKLLFFIQN